MYFRDYLPPPPTNRMEAERNLYDALWDHYLGNAKDAKEALADIANYVQERTLDGSYEKAPEQITEEAETLSEGSTDVHAC